MSESDAAPSVRPPAAQSTVQASRRVKFEHNARRRSIPHRALPRPPCPSPTRIRRSLSLHPRVGGAWFAPTRHHFPSPLLSPVATVTLPPNLALVDAHSARAEPTDSNDRHSKRPVPALALPPRPRIAAGAVVRDARRQPRRRRLEL
ncbi:hypothetical protein DCS_00182 [Drechmeria coniospora]|uniref:Uncharacterized protein n=1 Tax=Drechmeria coniospora TaxID=98403 RepID=A0A151GPL9_DRECN|nr:hypothetical protein DCS_00182 [Drechmeria coniospora]KYK59055.1 hypothetical protein DCS_00182 [Drechmeria coniospora]